MIAFVSVLLFVAQQPTVSIHTDAIQAKLLVAELAKQSGLDIACDPILAKEPVVCDFESAPVEGVLSRLAIVVGGEWRQVGNQRRLSRSTSMTAKFERDERDFFTSKIATVLDTKIKELAELPALTEAEANRFANQTRLQTESQEAIVVELLYFQRAHPAAIATYKLLNSIGSKTISSISVDQRSVFSDFPTRMQVQLPPGSTAIIQQLLRDAELIQLAKIKFKLDGERARFGGVPEILSGDPKRYKKSLLALRNLSGNRISISLSCWDLDNKRIATFNTSIPDASSVRLLYPPHKGDVAEFPKEITDLASLQSRAGVREGGGGGVFDKSGKYHPLSYYKSWAEFEGKPIDYGYGSLLQDPVKNDPIGLTFGKVTRELARKRSKWLIASAGDNVIYGLSEAIYRKRVETYNDILQVLEQTYLSATDRVPFAIATEDTNWIVIAPRFPNRALKTRYNREAAKNLIFTMLRTGCLGVEDGIAYISKNPHNPAIFSPDLILFENSVLNAESQAPGFLFTDALPLLKDLGYTMLASIANRPVRAQSLNPMIHRLLEKKVFAKEITLAWEDHQEGDPDLNGKDPTEVFPDGIPLDAVLEVQVNEEEAVLAKSSMGYYFQLSMVQLAAESSRNNPRIESPGNEKPREYVAFAPIFMKTYSIKLRSGNRTLLSISTRGATRVPGSLETKLEGLPPRHLAALAEAKKLIAPDSSRVR